MMAEADEVLLQAYLDGELEPAEAERVRIRVENSPEWRAREQELRELLADCARYFAVIDDDDPALRGESPTVADAPSAGETDAPAALAAAPPTRAADAGVISLRPPRPRVFGERGRWLMAASIAVVAVGSGAALWIAMGPQGDRGVVAGAPAGRASADRGAQVASAGGSPPAPPSVAATPSTPDSAPTQLAEAPVARRRPTPAEPAVPTRRERTDPLTTPVTLAGLTPVSTTVDTSLGLAVRRDVYEVRPGVSVALEIADAPEMATTRGAGDPVRRAADTSARVHVMDSTLAITWHDPSGLVLRLRGAVSEQELTALRRRVRLDRQAPP